MEFEPLVRVDPSVMPANREPLQNPRLGDYLLKQTASTEGIASKKSLELKKRYLLGDAGLSSGIMKSDSMSMLDSKFRNFRSTITDCQKLLNPAPAAIVDAKPVAEPTNKSQEEKENRYDQIVSTRNEINKTDVQSSAKPVKAIENGDAKDIDGRLSSRVDESPSKKGHAQHSPATNVPSARADCVNNDNKTNSIEVTKNIELKSSDTRQSTNANGRDKAAIEPLEAKVDEYKPVYEHRKESDSNYFMSSRLLADRSKSLIEMGVKKSTDQEKTESASYTPYIVWSQTKNGQKRPDSDTFSSSTSSPADIPHFILESTTSPDTHNTPSEQTPVEPKIDDLMQMDSLMLIDGKYVGDPEDLKLLKLPDNYAEPIDSGGPVSTTITATVTTTASSPINKTIIHVPSQESVVEVSGDVVAASKPKPSKPDTKLFKYEPIYKRPAFRFDTKNENKIDTLKNIPLIMPTQPEPEKKVTSKPTQLPLPSSPQEVLESPDYDKTPTASNPGNLLDSHRSDSETEMTGHVLTETELSDWTCDDAVSENFVDVEFALNSKGTIKRNRKSKKKVKSPDGQAPIATNLDFDELEFMDTGSEESYIETYAATNKAMLNNRGYVQFVNTHGDAAPINHHNAVRKITPPAKPMRIDLNRSKDSRPDFFIEQGALLNANDADLKTPMNENVRGVSPKAAATNARQTSDGTAEIDDDSVLFQSQGGNTTTEESDALTVVTSPMESAPRYDESPGQSPNRNTSSIAVDAMPKKSTTTALPPLPPPALVDHTGVEHTDEITYEDYVRQLQLKITQISNARDSIDVRKTKRKHSRVASDGFDGSPPIGPTTPPHTSVIDNNSKSLSIYVGKSEPTTVVEKIEEITKERMKEKDLIHDLVMDKLQSKKQSNAERRLSRSRNRNSALTVSPRSPVMPPLSHASSSSSLAAVGPMATNASPRYSYQPMEPERRHCLPNQSNVLSLSPTKELSLVNQSARKSGGQRPRSANVEEFSLYETPKLSKTQSFCVHTNRDGASVAGLTRTKNPPNADYTYQFLDSVISTPVVPRRRNMDDELTQTTEKLRQDARLRARLKSNQDLGLSPEEKIAMLRKRYNLDNSMQTASAVPCSTYTVATSNKSDDMKVRERKMTTSKSVNDISGTMTTATECNPLSIGALRNKSEFTSNPNLGDVKATPKRRPKDPERRKSIIQAVSDFFHKKRDKESPATPKEKSEGMFGRLRISPKSKSKVLSFYRCFFHSHDLFF